MLVLSLSDHSKLDNRAIQQKTKQLVDIVEQRNALVELLDEERKRYVFVKCRQLDGKTTLLGSTRPKLS